MTKLYARNILKSTAFRQFLPVITLVIFSSVTKGQSQDCFNAISVCTDAYVQTISPAGYGTTQEIQPGETCLKEGEINSVWYIFKIKTAGTLLFNIGALNPADDYDFAIYNLTNNNCSDIANHILPPVRCNFSSAREPTGLISGSSDTNVGSSGSPYCAPMQVSVNEVYVLMISNFTGSTSGFALKFSGTAVLFDTEAPSPLEVKVGACNPTNATLVFSERIKPKSVASNGSDFSITGPSAVNIISASVVNFNSVLLKFDTVISVPGDYNISLKAGSDGNTITDICDNAVNIGMQSTFNIPFAGVKVTIASKRDASCNSLSGNGSATASIFGGTPPYTYSWNTKPLQYSLTATNLSPGKYTIKVTDANGCTSFTSATIKIIGPDVSVSVVNDDCNNPGSGSATALTTGGTPPYSYSWSTTPVQTTQTASGIATGIYTVVVTDAGGCSSSQSISISMTGGPGVQLQKTDVACDGSPGGSITVVATGMGPFSYTWSGGYPDTSFLRALAPGNYSVTVTDQMGCKTIAATSIIKGSISITPTVTDVVCGNQKTGAISVSVTNANGPFTYTWNTKPVRYGSQIDSLGPGTYRVIVKDVNGCRDSLSVTVKGPAPILINATATEANCTQDDGSISTIVKGGVMPYSYSWNTQPMQSTSTASNLPAGVYKLTVTDKSGCTETETVFVNNVDGPDAMISSSSDATCQSANGRAEATVLNGAAPYTYEWTCLGCASTISTSSTLSNVLAGVYDVKITDSKTCITFLHVKINNIPMVQLSISASSSASCGGADGQISVVDDNLVGNLTYQWIPGGYTGSSVNRLNAGDYLIIATDAMGCKDSVIANVAERKAVNDLVCHRSCAHGLSEFEGTTDYNGPVTWQWHFGDPNGVNNTSDLRVSTHEYTGPGPFTVTLYINGGCATDTIVKHITASSGPKASFSTKPEKIYARTYTQFVYDGTPVTSWQWDIDKYSVNAPAPAYQFPEPGWMDVRLAVTDDHGCLDSITKRVMVLEGPSLFTPGSFTPNEDGLNDRFVISANGLVDFSFRVFNRNGELVFESKDSQQMEATGWDGKVHGKTVPPDTYVYYLLGELEGSNEVVNKTGVITVVY